MSASSPFSRCDVLSIAFACLLCCTASARKPDEQISLFNGQDLQGWTIHSGTATFEVIDGVIVGTTAPMTPNTFLCTEREFDDFELELDVWCDPELNSGIQIRSQIAGEGKEVTITKNPNKPKTLTLPKDRVYGYQVEIAKAASGRTGGIYDEARRFVFLDDLSGKPEAQQAFKDDQWNHIRIRCEGQRLRTWVNGVPCADVNDAISRRGVIGLQVHGNIAVTGRIIHKRDRKHQVRFRNLSLRELTQIADESTGQPITGHRPHDRPPTPYADSPIRVPGRIEMERFDRGGEGVAYHDTEETNLGSGKLNLEFAAAEARFRRNDAVDLSFTKPPRETFRGDLTVDGNAERTGQLYLGWTKPGEWIRYTVDVEQSGRYQISGHVSADKPDASMSIHFSGNDARCEVELPHTSGAHLWITAKDLGSIDLKKGTQVMTLHVVNQGSFNVNWLEFSPIP